MSSSGLIWFHHLHKCAGTLVVKCAESAGLRFWPESHNGNPHRNGQLIPLHDYTARQLQEFVETCLREGVEFIATEFGSPDFDVLASHPAVTTITIMREPYARFRSNYLFAVNCGYTTCRSMKAFSESSSMTAVANFYVRTFSRTGGTFENDLTYAPECIDASAEIEAKRVLQQFDHVLIQESADLSAHVGAIFDQPAINRRPINANHGRQWRMLLGRAKRRQFRQFYAGLAASRHSDDTFEQRFRMENQPDYRLYEFAKQLAPEPQLV